MTCKYSTVGECISLLDLSVPYSLGNVPPVALIVALPYVQSSYITTIAFLTLSCGLSPLCQSGVYINALDIAPR